MNRKANLLIKETKEKRGEGQRKGVRAKQNGGLSSFCGRKGESQCVRGGKGGGGGREACCQTVYNGEKTVSQKRLGQGIPVVPELSRRRKANPNSAEQLGSLVFQSKKMSLSNNLQKKLMQHYAVAH